MAMQRLLSDPNFEDDLQDLSSQVINSQLPSPNTMFMHNQTQVGIPHNVAPMFPSASPMFFRMPFGVQPSPITPPTSATGGTQLPPRASTTVRKKGVKRGGPELLKVKEKFDGSEGQFIQGGQAQQGIDVDAAIGKAHATKRGRGKKKPRDSQGLDDEGDGDLGRAAMSKDFWVVSLIHECGRMNDEFNKPPKQGIDLWSKIANKLASAYSNFDKDSEACRKKWGQVYDKYKEDKLYTLISGNDFKKSCKWFDIVDEYMHDRAHVHIYSHASATGEPVLPDESNATSKVPKDSTNFGPLHATNKASSSTSSSRHAKKDLLLEEYIASAKETGRGILSHLQQATKKKDAIEERREAWETRRMDILENIGSALVWFMDHVTKK